MEHKKERTAKCKQDLVDEFPLAHAAQPSMHWPPSTGSGQAGGSRRHASRQAFLWLRVFSDPKQCPRPPTFQYPAKSVRDLRKLSACIISV